MRIESTVLEGDPRVPAGWRVLTVLLRHGALSQSDLRERTGLSHPVIVQQVARLRKAGLIILGQPISGKPGRPRTPLTFNWGYRRLLTVEVHQTGVTLQATNLAGEAMSDQVTVPVTSWTAAGIRETLYAAIQEQLVATGAPWGGVGIVLPAVLSADGQTVTDCLGVADWQTTVLCDDLSERFEMPVVVVDEAEALAGARWMEMASEDESLVAVSLRHNRRVALCVTANGETLRGTTNLTDRLGHIPVRGNALPCACGLTGCLETLVRAAQDDPAIRPQAVQGLGEVLATAVTLLNPDHLIIQGDAAWTSADTEVVQSAVTAMGYPAAAQKVRVQGHASRPDESLQGVACLLANRLLDLRQGLLTGWAAGDAVDEEALALA